MVNNPLTPSLNSMTGQSFIPALVSFLINALIIIAIIYFIFNLILGGIDWINSAGDKTKVESARSRVVNAVLGIILVLITFAIITFIGVVFGVNLTSIDLSELRIVNTTTP